MCEVSVVEWALLEYNKKVFLTTFLTSFGQVDLVVFER